MQKLAETIKAYRGWAWSDGGGPTPPLTLAGDLNGDNHVDIADLRIAIAGFSNLYNIYSISEIIGNFGK